MIEVGEVRVSFPEVREWKAASYSPPLPDSADTFYTNENGSKIVLYLTPGNHDRLWTDMDEFARLESSSQWQQFLARDYVQFGDHRAIRGLVTLGPAVQVQYFFETGPATLLAVVCTFGHSELVSPSRFDFMFSGFHLE